LPHKLFRRKNNIAWRTIEGTTFLVHPSTKKIFPLNEVGNSVWLKLETAIDFDTLTKNIYNEFDANFEMIKQDLNEFLESLLSEGLIERQD